MKSCKQQFRDFLVAWMEGNETLSPAFVPAFSGIWMNMMKEPVPVDGLVSALQLTPEYNVRTSTVTNCMEIPQGDTTVLYATVHHLLAIDENQEIFPLVYGGKYRFVYSWEQNAIESVTFDLEYIAGNTWLTHGVWMPLPKTKRLIDGRELYREFYEANTPEETLYRFFWAMDAEYTTLFNEYAATDIYIKRAGVDGDFYELNGSVGVTEFLAKDKAYYSQNQYSIHINRMEQKDENHVTVNAWRLYPANTGNKHLGSQNKYSQFYNEIIDVELEKTDGWRVKQAIFKRKENPTPYGYQVLEL